MSPEFRVTAHRHGPKDGPSGPLSISGVEVARDHFASDYEGITFSKRIEIETSPINRAVKTAAIFAQTVSSSGNTEVIMHPPDERLSEGDISYALDIYQSAAEWQFGDYRKWVQVWLDDDHRRHPNVKTGKEAAADFAEWLIERYDNFVAGYEQLRETEDSPEVEVEVDAFFHGPVAIAFFYELDKRYPKQIMHAEMEDNLFFNKFNYLCQFNFKTSSIESGALTIDFDGHTFEVPVEAVRSIVKAPELLIYQTKQIS